MISNLINKLLQALGLKAAELTVDGAIGAFQKALATLERVAEHQDCKCEEHEAALKQAQAAAAEARAEADRARAIAQNLKAIVL